MQGLFGGPSTLLVTWQGGVFRCLVWLREVFAAAIAHDVEQTANFAMFVGWLVIMNRFIHLPTQIFDEFEVDGPAIGRWGSRIIGPAGIYLCRIPIPITRVNGQLVLIQFHMSLRFRRRVVILSNYSQVLLGQAILYVRPWLYSVGGFTVIRHFCHLVEVGDVILFWTLLVEEDVRLLEVVTSAVTLYSRRELFTQPFQKFVGRSGEWSIVAAIYECFYGPGECLFDDGVLHEGEFKIGYALMCHQFHEIGQYAFILTIGMSPA